jgi:hypothetical protein
MRTMVVRMSVVTALLAGVLGIGASAAGAVTLHQYPGQYPTYQYGGCPAGYYNTGGTCAPTNGGYNNQFGCPSGTFYNGAQCSPTRYDSYPNACPGGYYFDGYACTFAGANRPGPSMTPTPLPRPYVTPLPPAPAVYAPPPRLQPQRVRHVRQTLPFTGTATVRMAALGLSLLLGGLLMLSARAVSGPRRA